MGAGNLQEPSRTFRAAIRQTSEGANKPSRETPAEGTVVDQRAISMETIGTNWRVGVRPGEATACRHLVKTIQQRRENYRGTEGCTILRKVTLAPRFPHSPARVTD